jgi:cytochrome P450
MVQLHYWLQAKLRGTSLPPGKLEPFSRAMDVDQLYALKTAKQYGPVFKTWWHGRYTTCVIGHDRGRQLLSDNEDRLAPRSIDLSRLFTGGWIRSMRGDAHRHHRRLLMQALQSVPVAAYEDEFRGVIRHNLEALIGTQDVTRHEIRQALRVMTSTIMLRVLFGVAPSSDECAKLLAHYRRFGPRAPAHSIDAQNEDAFIEITRCIDRISHKIRDGAAEDAAPSMLRHLIESGSDTETALGNLIYMFEPAHYDLYSLWHWVMRYIAAHKNVAECIAQAKTAIPGKAGSLIRAAILETLRLEQSEVLYRQADTDLTSDGMFFPRGGIVRICLWEGHKDEKTFPEPFAFRPERFLEREFRIDEFAPFGLDKHRCIGADLSIDLTAIFLEELTNFECRIISDGPAQFGAYHWEPSAEIKLTRYPTI